MNTLAKSTISLLTIIIMHSPLHANAAASCSAQAKKLAVQNYGGKVKSAHHIGNGNWSVTIVYSAGKFALVTVFPGCQ